MDTAVLVGVTTGVMKPLLSKLTKLLEEEYVKLKGVRKQIKFLRDELSTMSATFQVLADVEQLDPETRQWRDKLRELAYDLEDCVDAFMTSVDNEVDGRAGFKRYFRKLKKLKARHEIAHQIEELKASVIEASERHKRYDLTQLKNKSSSSSIDPRLQALYEDINKLALPDNNRGSRIITTTRSVTVAKSCSSQVHEMEALSFDDSKRLFFRRAFGSENSFYPHLEDVPDKILSKCGGLPLAIVTVSGILSNEFAKAEWDRVLNAIGSALAKKPVAKTMTSILSLSYYDIPHHLRTCLLYFSVYPEDYEIEKQCLISRWITEAFIHDEEGKTKYEIGEGYFNDLINRSMIQPVKVKYGQVKACRVHDIILDYIKCKAEEENFVNSLDDVKPICTSEYKVRRLCVRDHKEENVTLWADKLLSQVRSITIFGQAVKVSFLPCTLLHVLDLGECRGMTDHHIESIGKLFNLKYLRLCPRSITRLPENVGELKNLQTLDVRGTSIKELPRTIKKLQKLAQLYFDWGARFPDRIISQMISLQELRSYGIQSYEQGQSIQEFSKLTNLRTLEMKWYFDDFLDDSKGRSQVQGIHNYVGKLLSSCNLHNLYIWDDSKTAYPLSIDSWHPAVSCNLLKLCIDGSAIYKVPNWMGSLGNLGVLKLWIICLREEDVEILGEIPSLLFLKLTTFGSTNGRIVFHGNKEFRSLKYFSLHIYGCGTTLEFKAGSMPKLEHVKLKLGVHKMECLNGASSSLGIQHLSSLRKVEIISRGGLSDAFACVSRAINAAIKTLPNHPTVRLHIEYSGWGCQHYASVLWDVNEDDFGGAISEWLEFLQIRKEANLLFSDGIDQATRGNETHEKEEEQQSDEKDPGEVTDEEEEEVEEPNKNVAAIRGL